jgi:DNA-binding IclR family transcriptional regulator
MSKIVGRTLDFLETFADQKRPLTASEIARRLDIPASSCHDVLQALLERGYLYELAPRGGFYPTLRLYDLAKTIADHDPVVQRADALLRSLRDTVDESILLSKVSGMGATYLLSIEPSHPLRFLANVGDNVRSLHATSAGKALLASLDEPSLSAYLKSASLASLTKRTITSKPQLREELLAGNRRGWFLNREESQEGVTTLSARFMWASALYIVTIAGPTSRVVPQLAKAAELLTSACKLLEAPEHSHSGTGYSGTGHSGTG